MLKLKKTVSQLLVQIVQVNSIVTRKQLTIYVWEQVFTLAYVILSWYGHELA